MKLRTEKYQQQDLNESAVRKMNWVARNVNNDNAI